MIRTNRFLIRLVFLLYMFNFGEPILCQSPSFKTYMNPVIPGDHPDCTLTRVGNDFYTTGSSFNPTPVIYHSTDLVHWEAISQPVSASWSGYGDTPSGGCWGGQLVYRNNKFWHFFFRGTMYFVTANAPTGPWSNPTAMKCPVTVPGLGYDNSIFIDEDNKWYLVVKNGQVNNWIVQLGDDGQPAGAIYDLRWINPAPSYPYSWAEGPVMWKYKGYYFYSFARDVSGGQKVMQSSTLSADQSAWTVPADFFNQNDPKKSTALFGNPNHSSSAVLLSDSTSWVIHPVYYTSGNDWRAQGRQGLLNQVRYDAAIKPLADYPINEPLPAPILPSSGIPWMVPKSDFFDNTSLNPEWSFLGYTPSNTWSTTIRPGWFGMQPRTGKYNTIVKNDAEHNYSLITRLDFHAKSTSDEAGIRLSAASDTSFVKIYCSINTQGSKVIGFRNSKIYFETNNAVGDTLWLKLNRNNHIITGYYSADGFNWTQVGQSIDITSMDTYLDMTNWSGQRQGLYVAGSQTAFFDLYIYRDAFSDISADSPANQFGTSRVTNILYNIHHNDWALYPGVEFRNKDYGLIADSVQFLASSYSVGGNIEIWLDSIDTGDKIGTCSIPSTGSWLTYKYFKAKIKDVTGRHDVYLKFTGTPGSALIQLKSLRFIPKNPPQLVNSNTLNDSVIMVKFNQTLITTESPTGFTISFNDSGYEPVAYTKFLTDSAILLYVTRKMNPSDRITISYNSGNLMSPSGLLVKSFKDAMVNNLITFINNRLNFTKSGLAKVYPNPTLKFFTVYSEKDYNLLYLYDISGRLILQKNYQSKINHSTIYFNMDKGSYILKLSDKATWSAACVKFAVY